MKFIYGGCEGNANNFQTLAECEATCKQPSPEGAATAPAGSCQLPAVTGPCKAAIRRFRYDPATGACVNFVYGGCQGNANNFETRADCEAACSK